MPYGNRLGRNATYNPRRSVIGEPEVSPSGNLILRVGRENDDRSEWWTQTEHVVLTHDEIGDFVVAILNTLPSEADRDEIYDRVCEALGYGT